MFNEAIKKRLHENIKKEIPKKFPVRKIRALDFGSADGHRDGIIEEAFIKTSAVRTFFQNNHSIICGVIGSGKSALFRLLKDRSDNIKGYEKSLIVPIEEAISFKQLNALVEKYFPDTEAQSVYQLIWLFQITINLSKKINDLDLLENSKESKIIHGFLKDISHNDSYDSIVDRIKNLISNLNVKVRAKFKDGPVTISSKIENKKSKPSKVVDLDVVVQACNSVLQISKFNNAVIIIDKIDRFVSGVDYETQRLYIQGLLEVEDDMYPLEAIKFKIFLRKDLFERIDFTALGYDKVIDNTIQLSWTKDEIIGFIAARIKVALIHEKILQRHHIFLSTNLEEYHLSGIQLLRLHPKIPKWLLNSILFGEKINRERKISLLSHLDRSSITKIFPRIIEHCNDNGEVEEDSICNFLETHFRDGHGEVTPRYLLLFLKEVQKKSSEYYDDNPDQDAVLVDIDGNLEWEVFKKGCVYNAYRDAKYKYTKNIEEADKNWTKHFQVFQSKKGNKTLFDYRWVRSILTDVDKDEVIQFLAFLQVIGYLSVKEHHSDITKRKYSLPILYRTDKSCLDVQEKIA